MDNNDLQLIISQIKELMETSRASVVREVNNAMLRYYWEVGRIIVEHEQDGEIKAKYGVRLLSELSKRLTSEVGRGYSKSNLYNMRDFYLTYPIFQMPSGKLSWSHYIELLAVSDQDARAFYEKECASARWSVKELNRQIGTSLYERLLVSYLFLFGKHEWSLCIEKFPRFIVTFASKYAILNNRKGGNPCNIP